MTLAEGTPCVSTVYYNHLAPYYKLIYADWEASLKQQATILDQLITQHYGRKPTTILDSACGIGTQCLGLAQLGYQVLASDISQQEIAQAQAEAAKRNLNITFKLGDMRQVWDVHQTQVEVVLACDNAIPHLLTDTDILTAFQSFFTTLISGGLVLISVRDYAPLKQTQPHFYPRTIRPLPDGGKIVIFDIWEFEGNYYDMTTYIIEDTLQPEVSTKIIRGGRYYCVQLKTLTSLLNQAGFTNVTIIKDHFFQPVIIGRKP